MKNLEIIPKSSMHGKIMEFEVSALKQTIISVLDSNIVSLILLAVKSNSLLTAGCQW